ncbi:OLC1v1021196C3 [Oldenlandia corymbosa var. corymbosa]|uniref:tRNA wybutosine-synthesizing protein 3 n=1 Tax=Oldenlandia corymbosa var. corymbosa TaxID=529605 RepID=A0AAV1BVE4_OLDCO|nr:OLC1v1021196C3 [Oldenlandia corymbosa var. corymbosa]
MEFGRRKAATLATMNSPEPDKSPKGNIDEPIIPLLNLLNSHPSYFTTSSCSGRISIFSHPVDPANSKKKAKGGSWLFISHDYPVEPTSVPPLLFPSNPTNSYNANELVFKFEPLIIAVECRDVQAASSLVSLAISCGFRESGITSVSKKRVIIAIRCSIRMEVPLGNTQKVMVSPEYLDYLIRVANDKMEANKKRTDLLFEALVRNGYGKVANGIGEGNGELVCGDEDDSECLDGEKMESLGDCLSSDDERKDLDDSQLGSSKLLDLKLSMSHININGQPVERLFLWGHSSCAISYDNCMKVLIFGGFGGIGRHARRSDLLLLDPIGGEAKAINVSQSPCPRIGHSSTALGDSIYVVGGRADPLTILGDVWKFKIGANEWSLVQCSGSQFSPRHRHAAAAIGSKIYVFGGVDNGVILSSLHVLDTQTLQWDAIPIQGEWPSPRHSHSMVAHRDNLYMFGGCDGEKALGDLYAFNVQACKWKKVNVAGREPTARFSHSMFVYNNYLGIIGGCPVSKHHKELSLLDLNSSVWTHFMINSTGSDLFVRSTASIIGHELVMIGGGASCYAFGTKFSEPTKINLLPVKSLADTVSHVKNTEECIKGQKPESADKSRLMRSGIVNPTEVSDDNIGHERVPSYCVLRLERKYAKFGKDILKKFGWLDLTRKVCSEEEGKYIYFPILKNFCTLFKDTMTGELADILAAQPIGPESLLVKDISETAALDTLRACGATKLEDKVIKVKRAPVSPLQAMKEAVASLVGNNGLPLHLLEELPSRWQRLGDIALLPVTSFKDPAWDVVAKDLWPVVAQSIGASRLARQGPIASTGTRDSTLEILVGDNGWVEHRENGILYSFDATKCMFSWGNLSEKLRMANLNCKDEIIVDLFAGIGYFTLPFLTRAGAKLVYACEWNPHALEALRRNLSVNEVGDRCVVLEGDNRVTAPKGVAHRVCLGLLPTSEASWLTAVRALRSDGGVMHIHANVKDTEESSWMEHVSRSIRDIATSEGKKPPISSNDRRHFPVSLLQPWLV